MTFSCFLLETATKSSAFIRCKTALCAVALLCLSFAAPQALPGQGIFESRGQFYSFSGVQFPSVVDTFAVLQAVRYPQVELGVSLQYSSPADPTARFSVYVYPVQIAASDEDVPRAEFERALEDIRQYAVQNPQRFQFSLQQVDSVAVMDSSGRAHKGWRATADTEEGGRSERSFLYVFVKEDSYLKYRLTYSMANADVMRQRADTFVRETLDGISLIR